MKLIDQVAPWKITLACLVAGIPAVASAADVVLTKAPPLTVHQAPAYPENLARYHFGADVKAMPESVPMGKLQLSSRSLDKNTAEAALLCDDPTTGYRLPAGQSSLMVSLSNIENVASVSFLNDAAEGSFSIAVSNAAVPENSPEWKVVANGSLINGAIATKIGPGEAKYVRLSFKVNQPGRIAAFGIYATPALSDFTMPRPRKVSFEENSTSIALISFNFSDLHAKARALYASSGELSQVNHMIDDQPATTYVFASGDAAPTAIIDLGRERNLSRLSAIYAAQAGQVEFYVLRGLPPQTPDEVSAESNIRQVANVPQTADLPALLKIDQQTFAGLKPVGSVANDREGRASVDFPETAGRYVMLKWHPASVLQSFSIAQVAAFGPARSDRDNNSAAVSEGKDAFDGREALDGKSIIDSKDIPAEGPGEAEAPAEGPPPSLPPVPPFTFIPQVPPTSP